jgi:uncharacterized protein (DUF1330 family)
LFLGLVAIGIAAAAIYLGPNGLAFVLHAERKSAPFVMVNLLDFEPSGSVDRYRAEYDEPNRAMIQSVGGRVLWEGQFVDLISGTALDRWPYVVLTEYPSRAAYIDLVTSSEYRARLEVRDAALGRSALFAGTPRQDFEEGGQFFAMRLVQGNREEWRVRYRNDWWNEDVALLDAYAGRLVWRAKLNPLIATDPDRFEEVFVFAFASAAARNDWATDAERRTLQSLEQRLLRRDVLLLLDPVQSDTQ